MKASLSRFLVAVLAEPSQPSWDRLRRGWLARTTDLAHHAQAGRSYAPAGSLSDIMERPGQQVSVNRHRKT